MAVTLKTGAVKWHKVLDVRMKNCYVLIAIATDKQINK